MHWTGVIVGRSSAKRVFRILSTFVTAAVATRQNAEPTKRFDVDDPDTWPEDDDEYEYDSYAAAALGRAAPNAHCESPTRARGPSLGAGPSVSIERLVKI